METVRGRETLTGATEILQLIAFMLVHLQQTTSVVE